VTRIIDLSLPIDEDAPEPFAVSIHRVGHGEGAMVVGRRFIYRKTDSWPDRLKKYLMYLSGKRRIDRGSFPDGNFVSHESVTASVHCGTHVDAPYHFGPECEGKKSKTAAEIPLERLYGDGVVLDMTAIAPGSEIGQADIERALKCISYELKANDIVLIMTGADKHFGSPAYFAKFPGMGVEAIKYLMSNGVTVMGIDAISFDRPFGIMVEDYYKSGDKSKLWPAHIFGRDREYFHIERLANLDKLPRPYGFKFACFPVKINGVGAAWARAVAIMDE